MNLKIPRTIFLLISFLNITNLKNTPIFILITIYIKTVIQIDKHKAKYLITARIPIIIILKI